MLNPNLIRLGRRCGRVPELRQALLTRAAFEARLRNIQTGMVTDPTPFKLRPF
jgi:hypothetical protein